MSVVWKMCFAVFMVLFVSVTIESASMMKREVETSSQSEVLASTPSTTTERDSKICDISFSCGWAVYAPFTREIKYFMKNSCECPEKEHCVRVDDDPALSAFVYKCRVKRITPAPQIEQ